MNLTVTYLVKIFTAYYDIRKFNTMMRSLSWASCNPSLLQLVSPHRRIVCPSGLSTTNLPTTILCVFLICPLQVKCPTHLFIFHLITIIGTWWNYEILKVLFPPPSSCYFPTSLVKLLSSANLYSPRQNYILPSWPKTHCYKTESNTILAGGTF
jgi:hypothetical protein